MKVKEIIQLLENWAPLSYQESYDNSGLIVGDSNSTVSKVLITLDSTEAVVDEAITTNCQMIISHHPILFSPIKRLTPSTYVEKTLIKAIKNDIAIYAIHTNLDNIYLGVNSILSEKIGLSNTSILQPKQGLLKKITTYIPAKNFKEVSTALYNIDAGHIGNYSHCGFSLLGKGSFKGNETTTPHIGRPNELEITDEIRFETIFPSHLEAKIIAKLKEIHPYEEVAYDILPISNIYPTIGAGMIGELEAPIELNELLSHLKAQFHLTAIKHTTINRPIKNIAVCGGSGSFLRHQLPTNIDAFITSDIKYHEWFDAEDKYALIDIGHYESEQYTKELIFNYLKKNALSLQSQISKVNTNPVKYYI